MKLINDIYPWITDQALEKLKIFSEIIFNWNKKINLISRKDIHRLTENHLIPSLAIGKICLFKKNTNILDVGTGGGFPGIPLAICFPHAKFTLIDSIKKKINIVEKVIDQIGLKNVITKQIRVEELDIKYDYIVARAVTALPNFIPKIIKNLSLNKNKSNGTIKNGLLYIKGGDYKHELKELRIDPDKEYNIYEELDKKIKIDKNIIFFSSNTLLKIP